ncbi:aliphatic sulfonate ABC transporter substrate-binding protein [Pelosinus sp. UFO1]|uniref:aliphatic sulfonate ABC transporter substrate-binding protein n=1 Tax=Pelosinus sp. UFO1 TaxID=484770 RepID=UPI0004D19396|nr:aliphatic sulfonate ABC transporter substrate-binding protein [Pelosinus sp. UFO1]AIF50686.1 aliphatic sulfonates family ABC transporter, periplasmic ligand-binding protein [Pelosinus sp. UFO1]
MKFVKFALVVTALIALAGGISGCSSSTTMENKNIKVRIAHFPNITHSQALVGRANGQFQKALGEANQIEWKTFNAGPAEIEALFAGEVDIGYIGPGPAINGYTKSKGDLQIIAGATDAGAILVTRKDLVLKNVGELSGKRIAVPQFGNTQDLSLRHILQENGLTDTTKGGTVEVRQADNPDIKTLLDKGEIDAALVPEPWGARLISEVKANVLLDHKQVWRDGNYTTAVVVARTKFIQDHPDVIEKFLRTHVELTDYINKNPEPAKETVNAQIKEFTGKPLAKEILDDAFKRLTVTNDPEKDSVIDFVKLSVDAGFIKTAPDLKNLFNFTILNKVLKEKGLKEIEN